MTKTNTFDVLVVYTESVATSASSTRFGNDMPFSLAPTREHYSVAYSYFLKICAKFGLRAAFSTADDIVGPGTCSSFWEYKENKWIKVLENAYAPLIFDKVSPLRKISKLKRKLLFSRSHVKPFNDVVLMDLFNDKLKTYKALVELTVPTVSITQSTVSSAILKLDNVILNHKNKNDFSKSFILKDRFGAAGVDIYKIDKNPIEEITKILDAKPKVFFVLQPFAKFDKGYSYQELQGYADVRLIYAQGKVVQRYVRTAKKRDFRCNEHQGGKVIYIGSSAVPREIELVASQILKTLNRKKALFALDFIVSNNGNAYFLEGNINPGIYWGNSIGDEVNTKKLINTIVKELKRRTEVITSIVQKRKFKAAPTYIPMLSIGKISA